MHPTGDVPIQWTAHEHQAKQHGPNWFWTVIAVAVAIALGAIIYGNVLLALLVATAAIALLLQTVKKPKRVTFGVGEEGVHIGKTIHLYQDLDSFGITDKYLMLKSKKRLAPYITIPIPPEHQKDVRSVLAAYVPEEEYTEPVADKIMEYLGF